MHLKTAFEIGVQLAMEEAGLVKTAIGTSRAFFNEGIANFLHASPEQQALGRKALTPVFHNTQFNHLLGDHERALAEIKRNAASIGETPEQLLQRRIRGAHEFPIGQAGVHHPVESVRSHPGTIKRMDPEEARYQIEELKRKQQGRWVRPILPW